jgi:hypothetical protein
MNFRTAAAFLFIAAGPATAQGPPPGFTTVEGIMTELYASVTRPPGDPFEWDRLRAIMLPGGVLLPQLAQTQGESRIMDVDSFIAWIDGLWEPILGTASDGGFFERETNRIVEEFGDVAHVFTTYEKGPYEPRRIQSRGINSVQMVKRDGRWYILSITWDEENSGGPLPPKYRGQ